MCKKVAPLTYQCATFFAAPLKDLKAEVLLQEATECLTLIQLGSQHRWASLFSPFANG